MTGRLRIRNHTGVPSGQLTIRMPPALHEQLIDRAKQQGMSLNTLIVALLAGGVGFKLDT